MNLPDFRHPYNTKRLTRTGTWVPVPGGATTDAGPAFGVYAVPNDGTDTNSNAMGQAAVWRHLLLSICDV